MNKQKINPQFSTWPAEKVKLIELLKAAPGTYAIEIGSFRGCTTVQLGRACVETNKQLIAIDPWDNTQDWSDDSVYYEFLDNIQPAASNITVIRSRSTHAIPLLPHEIRGKCGFIFVDGDHSYEGTLLDLQLYYPLLMPGGTIAIHDVLDVKGWEGVGRAVDDFFNEGSTVQYLKYVPTKEERNDYQHGISGIAWSIKPA